MQEKYRGTESAEVGLRKPKAPGADPGKGCEGYKSSSKKMRGKGGRELLTKDVEKTHEC